MLYAKLYSTTAGYGSDQRNAKLLDVDKIYPVTAVDMGQSYTWIKLDGFAQRFNSVNLKFFTKVGDEYVEHDIYSDPEYNPYL